MKESSQKLIEKSSKAIHTSERSLADGDAEAAASRAYYAMFYVAEALLGEKDLRFRKHGGVHAAFGEQFSKPGIFDPKYHRWLLQAFNKRISADYDVEAHVTSEDVKALIQQAREFLQAAQQYLASQS